MNFTHPLLRLCTLMLAASLGACTVVPQAISEADSKQILQTDRELAFKGVPPINGPLSLEEAIARALKYNLDHRVRLIQQALASDQLEAGKFDMLPKLLANAGYATRDNDATRKSLDPITGTVSTSGFVSADQSHVTADLGLLWNVLDFGASYYNSKQNADLLLIAKERRRKAMHTLIQSVRTAYWRALAAQTLSAQLRSAIEQGEAALADARKVSAERVKNPADSLRFQRLLLENLRLMEGVERELAGAQIELASLIGGKPGDKIVLSDKDLIPPPLTLAIAAMEETALQKNADLRESMYNVRIAAAETRKSLIRLLPGLTFDYAYKYDNDTYLVNQHWRDAGFKVSFNLFNVLSGPSRLKAAERNEKIEQARRMALQMSVLTQVHLAYHQFGDAQKQYERADEIYQVDQELSRLAQSQEASRMASQLDRISANVTFILSSVRRYQAIAKVHEAASRVQASLGLEPEISSLDDADLKTVQNAIQKTLLQWGAGS